jgi:membrane-associated phospholipid phosphatase
MQPSLLTSTGPIICLHRVESISGHARNRSRVEFIVRQCQTSKSFGLSLSIGLTVVGANIGIFAGLLHEVLHNHGIALFDDPIANYVATHRIAWLTECLQAITYLGSDVILTVVVIVGGLFLYRQTSSWRPLFLLSASAIGASLLHTVLGPAIGRQRPTADWMTISATGQAFPSGHASESTAVYGALAYLLCKIEMPWRVKLLCLTAGALIPLLVGVSRVYLGVHWLTDVIAGWALGVAWLALIFTTASIIEKITSVGGLDSRR